MFEYGYVIGVVLGDGCLYKYNSNYSIILETTNPMFANRFKNAIESLCGKKSQFKTKTRTRVWNRGKKTYEYSFDVYRVEMYSKLWFNIIGNIKERILNDNFCPMDKDFCRGIIKGFFDSEGYYAVYKYPWKKIVFYNKNIVLLNFIKSLLSSFGISVSGIYPSVEDAELTIYKQNEVNKITQLIDINKK